MNPENISSPLLQKLAALWTKYREALLYLIFGGLTTLLNIVAYALLTRLLSVDYLLSNIIAWTLSVLFAFITNKLVVFQSRRASSSAVFLEAVLFFGGRLFSLGVDTLILYVGVDWLHWHDLVVKILSNVVVIILNYFISKLLVFRKKR